MYVECNGERKRSVIIEGTIDPIDNAPVRKSVGKEITTYQFKVLVEFDQTSEKVYSRSVFCNYYVKHKDETKKGSEKLISSLTRRERIICFGNASAGALMNGEKLDRRIPLSISVHSFILPDRLNALLAGLTDCEETVFSVEDTSDFEIDRKQTRKNVRQSQKKYAKAKKSTGKKQGKEKPKYAFD